MTPGNGASLIYDPLGRLYFTTGSGGTYYNYAGDKLLLELQDAAISPRNGTFSVT